MNMQDISLPAVYKKSADFRMFLKWFTTVLSKIQYDADNFFDLYDPERCPRELLWALADTMGFKYDDRLPASFNRLVLLYFMSMIRNRGSQDGMTLAAEVNLAQFKILMQAAGYTDENETVHEGDENLYNRLDDTSIPVNSAVVTPHTKEGYIDVVYFSTETPLDACIEYVRPVGMYLFQHAGVKFSPRTKISVEARLTDSRDTRMSYGPTCVGHYRRDDYARLQKTIDVTSGTNQWPENDTLDTRHDVWYRNSKAEGTPQYNYAGYRALYSLQLSNNEEVVKALIDPIFTLGFGPTSLSEDKVETIPSPDYGLQRDPQYNLRYDIEVDEENTPKNADGEYLVYTIDKDRSPNPDEAEEDNPTPMPAVNAIMVQLGDAVSLNDDNSAYVGGFTMTNEDDYIYIIENEEVTILNYLGHGNRIVVPKKLEGYPVVTIACTAFSYNESLVGVKLPSTVRIVE